MQFSIVQNISMAAAMLVALMLTTCMLPAQSVMSLSSNKLQEKASSLLQAASLSTTQHYNIKDVVELLRKMRETCESEAKADLEEHDKKQCACETMQKERNIVIDEETGRIIKFDAEVDESLGQSAMLKTQIEGLLSMLRDSSETLTQLRKQREKDNRQFLVEEDDLAETVDLLKEAIEALDKVNFQQTGSQEKLAKSTEDGQALIQVKRLVKRVQKKQRFAKWSGVMQRDLFQLLGSIEENTQKGFLSKFLQFMPENNTLREETKPNDLEGNVAGVKSYNARSGRIFGILKTMREQVAKDLKELRDKEADAVARYTKLKLAILDDIRSYNEQTDEKQEQLAYLMQATAIAKDGSKDENAKKVIDERFLRDLMKGCVKARKAYEERSAIRADELKALDETLKILTSDESRSMMAKTIYFLQTTSGTSVSQSQLRKLRKSASERLLKIAQEHHNQRLALLATRVKLDAFEKVRASMNKMLTELKKQQMNELKTKDACVKNIDEAEDEIKLRVEDQEDLAGEMTKIVNTIEGLQEEIKSLKEDIANLKIDLKLAGETRSENNLVFQTAIGNQRATAVILKKALKKLKAFYAVQDGSLIQTGTSTHGSVPVESRSKVALVQLETIIRDAQVEEKEMFEAERQAQADYTSEVEDTSNSLDSKADSITKKEEELAAAQSKKAELEEATIANDGEIEKQEKLIVGYKTECTFLMKYFDVRQKARMEEMDSIVDARAILAGTDSATILK